MMECLVVWPWCVLLPNVSFLIEWLSIATLRRIVFVACVFLLYCIFIFLLNASVTVLLPCSLQKEVFDSMLRLQ
jgi:hypothetical protein